MNGAGPSPVLDPSAAWMEPQGNGLEPQGNGLEPQGNGRINPWENKDWKNFYT